MITPIDGLRTAALLGQGEGAAAPEGTGGLFTDVFKSAIQNVRDTDAEKTQAEYLLATGQLDNPAEMMIAMTKAHSSVDLLVQLRNKALDAYSEITRISI